MRQRGLSVAIYALTTLLGAAAFLYPFWLPAAAQAAGSGMAHAADAPLMVSLLAGQSSSCCRWRCRGGMSQSGMLSASLWR